MAEPKSATQNYSSLKGRSENRIVTCGFYSFQVTGDGHGGRPFGNQPFSLRRRNPGASSSSPRALRPSSLRCVPLYSILHTRYSHIVMPSCPRRISPCPLVTVPTCPLALALLLHRRAEKPASGHRDDLEVAAGGRDAAAVDFLRLPRRRIKVKPRGLPILRLGEAPDPALLPGLLRLGP